MTYVLGIHYNGTVNVILILAKIVRNGIQTLLITSLYRHCLEGHNYCHNPEGCNRCPWCYTMDPNVRWEYCDVLLCVHVKSNDETMKVIQY